MRVAYVFTLLAVLFAAALGLAGVALVLIIALGVWLAPRTATEPLVAPQHFALTVGAAAFVLFARPFTPLFWDEFVWLAKARLGSSTLSGVVEASLDPTLQLIPAGYVPLWPSAVSWLSFGVDSLAVHTFAASVLVFCCFAAALEAWWPVLHGAGRWNVVLAIATPLALVHFRSTYVDLPVGLLGAALLGHFVHGRFGLWPISLAVTLAGFKDEGFTHVMAATVGAMVLTSPVARWRRLGPLVAAACVVVLWRLKLSTAGVVASDHALNAPAFAWGRTFLKLLALHATDVVTWGLTWAVVLAVVVTRPRDDQAKAVRVMLACNLVLLAGALLVGPERVRVFAENGTLLNRALLQSWPLAVLVLLTARPAKA